MEKRPRSFLKVKGKAACAYTGLPIKLKKSNEERRKREREG